MPRCFYAHVPYDIALSIAEFSPSYADAATPAILRCRRYARCRQTPLRRFRHFRFHADTLMSCHADFAFTLIALMPADALFSLCCHD
jgi:hypothetical protein